jgi:DNA-binding transcriptional LysR family regulator
MDHWDDFRIFLAVARLGGYSQAAKHLRLVQTTVGRRIAALEARMGTKLFARRRTGMQLTPRGIELAELATGMDRAARMVEHHLVGSDDPLSGPVSISASDGMAAFWLVPQLPNFHSAFSSIQIEIVDVSSWAGLLTANADLMVRYTPLPPSQIISRKIGRSRFAVFAAPAYLAQAGTPATVNELRHHRLIENVNFLNNAALSAWSGIVGAHGATLRVNSAAAALSAVRCGCGLALLPRFYRSAAPEMIELDLALKPLTDVWLASDRDMLKLSRVKTVVDYLADRFHADPELAGW